MFDKSYCQSRYKEHAKYTHTSKTTIIITPCVTHVSLGSYFDKKIFLNSSLVYLDLSESFNQPIVINKNIVFIIFGEQFNQSFKLNKQMEILKIGSGFKQPFQKGLSKNPKYLSFNFINNTTLDFPKKLVYLALGTYNNNSLVLTPNIKYFITPHNYKTNIIIDICYQKLNILSYNTHVFSHLSDSLPDGVGNFAIVNSYTFPLNNLPNCLDKSVHIWGCACIYWNKTNKTNKSNNTYAKFRFVG